MTQHYIARKIVLAWEQEKDGQAGYAVKYRDGYISWCPKAKFEEDNIALGHTLGSYPYEQQLIMAQVVELEQRLLAIADEEGDIAQMERDVIKLHQDILKKRIEQFDLSREVVEEVPQKPALHTFFPVKLVDFKDFNFFRAAASEVPCERDIVKIELTQVKRNGELLTVNDPLNVPATPTSIQIAGRIDGIGIFNIVVDTDSGNLQSATRPSEGEGTFAELEFGFDVSWSDGK